MSRDNSDDAHEHGLSIEDLIHTPGSGVPHRHLPERNRDPLNDSHDLTAVICELVRGHNVRVVLTSDFSSVSVAVVSDCFGFAEASDLEDLANAALKILANGGYGVALYPRHALSDASLVVTPAEGKAPRTDVSLEFCVRSLAGGR